MNRAYVRVSTIEQNLDRQIEGLKKHNIDIWYTEKVSGKNVEDRKELKRMLSEAQEGDTIFIHDFSRLARSTKDLLTIVEDLNNRGIHLVSNKEFVNTSTPSGKLMLTMIGAIAEFERTNMLERQREGIVCAKARNAYANCGGKEKQIDDSLWNESYTLYASGTINKSEFAERIGVSRPTLNRLLERRAA